MTAMTDEDGHYLAGHLAPPGRYRRLGAPYGRELVLERPDVLPASLDGHVAVYVRLGTAPVFAAHGSSAPARSGRRRPGLD
jgi:hypothetical protein